jgi:trans-2,3-dihydro-3-hydroxyanthranilate isomerase
LARFEYQLVDVFTPTTPPTDGEIWQPSGNPLAVFSEAHGLDPLLMQRIAFELNLSETTFVLPTERSDCDVRVRIFTPRAELAMAGHPTVGTAFVLDRGDRIVFEEGVGPVPVERVRGANGASLWQMTQPPARFGSRCDDRAAIAAALSLDLGDLDPGLPCESIATGPPFVMLPLRSLDALARARLRADAWEPIERSVDSAPPYLFVRTGATSARCRMFAPSHGIAEDPATGAAAGPLGAYWAAHGLATPGDDGVLRVTFTQGVEFGMPSELFVEVEGTAIRVAGACHAVGGGWFEL